MEVIGIILIVILLIYVYFFPTDIANKRNAEHVTGIFILNLFLGWTLVGWVIALVWAVSSEAIDDDVDDASEDEKECPFCAEIIKLKAKVCRFCNRDLPIRKS